MEPKDVTEVADAVADVDVSSGNEEVDMEEALKVDDDQGWDDWEEEQGMPTLCLFCDGKFNSSRQAFEHMKSSHGFDFYTIKKDLGLDFYGAIRLINYIRATKPTPQQLTPILSSAPSSRPWNPERYLTPVIPEDPLLCIDDDDDFSSESESESEKTKRPKQKRGDDVGSPRSQPRSPANPVALRQYDVPALTSMTQQELIQLVQRQQRMIEQLLERNERLNTLAQRFVQSAPGEL